MHLKRDDDTLPLFVILAFVVFRVTRFLMFDTLIDKQRQWLLNRLMKAKLDERGWPEQPSAWRWKLLELAGCPWCLSIWVAMATTLVAGRWRKLPLPLMYFPALSGASLVIWDQVSGSTPEHQ